MYDLAKVQEGLSSLVGFRNNPNPQFGKIDDYLTVSESGIYFDAVHPLVNLETLYSICQNIQEFVFDPYKTARTYSKGEKVTSGSLTYESLVDANTGNPVTDTNFWKEKTKQSLFSDWLNRFKVDGIAKVLNKVIEAKKIRSEVKDVFENLDLYQGIGRADDTIVKSGRFVFFQIVVKETQNLTVTTSSISTQFNTAQGLLTIYVYHENSYEAEEIEIDLEKVYSQEKVTVDSSGNPIKIILRPGVNYIGYYEDDLVGQALRKKDYFWNTPPCGSCNYYNTHSYQQWSKYVKITPGYVDASYLPEDGRTLWDLSKNVYEYNTNYGLNFSLSVKCDLSDWIIDNRSIFSNAYALQVATDLVGEIGNNSRNNAVSEQTRKLALFALDNRDNYSVGLITQLDKAIKAVDFDMSSLGDCLPCKEARGIRRVAI